MYNEKDLAEMFEVSKETIINWRKKVPEIKEAFFLKRIPYKDSLNKNRIVKKWCIEDWDLYIIKEFAEKRKHFLEAKAQKKNKPREYWTRTSIECYKAKMVCKNCVNEEICKRIPSVNSLGCPSEYGLKPIQWLVKKLFAEFGEPIEIAIRE